jgi:chlorobactene glucosyltransferase
VNTLELQEFLQGQLEIVLEPDNIFALSVALLVALMIFVFARRSRRQYLRLPELVPQAEADCPDHAVVIPARDEAAVIARAVRSFPESLTVVVDDLSEDHTAEVARGAGAEVRPANPLNRGWLGKPNACWTGACYTESEWLAFVDADTWFEPVFLPSLLNYAVREELHAATVFPRQHCVTWYEKALLPYALGLYFAGVSARNVNNPRHAEALANGQCLLFRRSAYDFIGGHRAVAGSVIEDVALAQLLKRHRMNIRVMRCEALASVRMYDSFGALWRGFQKNSFRFLQINRKTGALVVAASIAMTSWLPVLALLLYQQLWLPAFLFFLLPAIAWRPWYGTFLRAMSAPLAIYVFQAIAVSAMFKGLAGFGTVWKGRRV